MNFKQFLAEGAAPDTDIIKYTYKPDMDKLFDFYQGEELTSKLIATQARYFDPIFKTLKGIDNFSDVTLSPDSDDSRKIITANFIGEEVTINCVFMYGTVDIMFAFKGDKTPITKSFNNYKKLYDVSVLSHLG